MARATDHASVVFAALPLLYGTVTAEDRQRTAVNECARNVSGYRAGDQAALSDGLDSASRLASAAATSSIVVPLRPSDCISSLKSCGLDATRIASSKVTRPALTWPKRA